MKKTRFIYAEILLLLIMFPAVLFAQVTVTEIVKVEYFFDTDPGYNNGIDLVLEQGETLVLEESIDLAGLAAGFHVLYMRAQDDSSSWSLPYIHQIYLENIATEDIPDIYGLEYFFDTDPGYGQGTYVNITPGEDVTESLMINISGLSPGLHQLYVRGHDENGQWSILKKHNLLVESEYQVSEIAWDIRSGSSVVLSGTVSDFDPGDDITSQWGQDITDLVDQTDYTYNLHAVYTNGIPSIPYTHSFEAVNNTMPAVASHISDITVNEDFTAFDIAVLDTIFSDSDMALQVGDTLSYNLVFGDVYATPVLEDSLLSLAPIANEFGSFELIVTATDLAGASFNDTLTVTVNSVNDLPTSFAKIAPVDEGYLHIDSVTVSWYSSTDIEDGVPSYRVEWSDDPDFSPVYSAVTADTFYQITDLEAVLNHSIQGEVNLNKDHSVDKLNRVSSKGTPVTTGLDELPDDTTIYWRVIAVDDDGGETYADNTTDGWSFSTDVFQSPLPFSLITTTNGDTVWTNQAELVWHSTTDPDPYDTPEYALWGSENADMSEAVCLSDTISDTSFVVTNLDDNMIYYWTVHAIDSNTPGTWASEVFSLVTYFPDAPMAFSLVAPDSGSGIYVEDGDDITFRWNFAEDPDPNDDLQYTLVLSNDAAFSDSTVYGPVQADSFFVEDLVIENYWWRVYASDRFDLKTQSSQTWTLVVTSSVEENPWGTIPIEYSIARTYPNPFNPTLNVVIGLPERADLKVVVYNIMGQQVAELAHDSFDTGYHSFVFNGKGLSSGVYFVQATVPGKMNRVSKIVMTK